MYKVVKSSGGKQPKKAYSTPKLVTHGDVAKLTRKHHRPRHRGEGPESELN